MTLPFHPLADLFPLIEGAEFDGLVASIKENGQREPIVVFGGAILDGRNRYRACAAAEVEPHIKEFTGTDPVKFVVDVNVRRRHLNETQRAMIAARIAAMSVGRPQKNVDMSTISIPSQEQAAEMMNVSRDTVAMARKVLTEGTDEEIMAAEKGQAAVTTIARQIRANKPSDQRKNIRNNGGQSAIGKNPERIALLRLRGRIWGQLRDALNNLTSLPLPCDVVSIARSSNKSGIVDAKLLNALEWLEGFSDAWTNKATLKDRNDNGDAAVGDRVAGTQ
jgi:hypothetical protein